MRLRIRIPPGTWHLAAGIGYLNRTRRNSWFRESAQEPTMTIGSRLWVMIALLAPAFVSAQHTTPSTEGRIAGIAPAPMTPATSQTSPHFAVHHGFRNDIPILRLS